MSDVTRSRLYKTKDFNQFLMKLHEKDGYFQQYNVICVHRMRELEKKRHKVALYNEILANGREL